MLVADYSSPVCSEIQIDIEGTLMVLSRPVPYSLQDMDDNVIFSEDF